MQDLSNEPSADEIVVSHRGRSLRLYLPSRETDHVQGRIAARGRFYESDMLGHMEAMLQPGDVVVDVGAYIGNHVVYLAGGCDARVVAFEPNPDSFAVMERNVEINALGERVELHCAGVGREQGRAAVHTPPAHNLGGTTLVMDDGGGTDVVALDSVELPGSPRILKIDVEGMESDVIAGASRTIREHAPLVYVEVRNKAALARVMESMRDWGYSATAQFNATPTVLMVPEQEMLTVLNAQLAFARHAMHTDLAAHGERLKRQLATQDAQAEQLSELQSTLDATATGGRIDELERRLDEARAASDARVDQQTKAVEDLRQYIEQRAAGGDERLDELSEGVVPLHEKVVGLDERVGDAVKRMEARGAEQLQELEAVREDLRATRRTTDGQARQLGRIEAELFSLKQRLASSVAEAGGYADRARPAPGASSRVRSSRLDRMGRKYRKLRRDPRRFFADAKLPLVGSLLARAYPASGRRR